MVCRTNHLWAKTHSGYDKDLEGDLRLSDKPPLGKNPFESEIAANTNVGSTTSATSGKDTGQRSLGNAWFQKQKTAAQKGIAQTNLSANMEVRFALGAPASKSPKQLLDAVQNSEIKTFGWPIGVTLQSREEYRPRPTQDGIKAEVSITRSQTTGRVSYDYWALNRQCDFFLLQSLFEDMRGENLIFFNTRIVRVTEALLFASNLYSALDVSQETKLKACIKHSGLAGRTLASSSPNRILIENRVSHEPESETKFVVNIGQIRAEIVDRVIAVCEPMFMLFDFAEFGRSVYEDIVYKFMAGVVS